MRWVWSIYDRVPFWQAFIVGWDHWEYWDQRCCPTDPGDPCQGLINSDEASLVRRQFCNPQIEKLLADVGTNKSNILEARIWLKDIKRDFAAMNGVFFMNVECWMIWTTTMTVNVDIFRCGTPGWTKTARECATVLRVILPEKIFWWKSRLLPPFNFKAKGGRLLEAVESMKCKFDPWQIFRAQLLNLQSFSLSQVYTYRCYKCNCIQINGVLEIGALRNVCIFNMFWYWDFFSLLWYSE